MKYFSCGISLSPIGEGGATSTSNAVTPPPPPGLASQQSPPDPQSQSDTGWSRCLLRPRLGRISSLCHLSNKPSWSFFFFFFFLLIVFKTGYILSPVSALYDSPKTTGLTALSTYVRICKLDQEYKPFFSQRNSCIFLASAWAFVAFYALIPRLTGLQELSVIS